MAPSPALCSGRRRNRYTGATSRPMAHRKAAISRAMAVTTTGSFLPVAPPTIPGTRPELGFPSDIAHRLRQAFDAGSQCFADPGGITICPSGFNQSPSRASIASKRQTLASHHIAGRALRRHQSEKRHQLSRRIEPAHIADFRGEGDGDQERGTAHRLIRRNHWRHGPTRYDECQLLFQAMQPLRSVLDRVNAFLEHDLLRCMLERLPGEPTPMRQRPMTAAAVPACQILIDASLPLAC